MRSVSDERFSYLLSYEDTVARQLQKAIFTARVPW